MMEKRLKDKPTFIYKTLSTVNPFMMSLVKSEERTSASSMIGTAWSMANLVTPSIGGYIMEHISLSLPFYVCALHYATSITLFYFFFHKTKIYTNTSVKLRNVTPLNSD
ncbi:MAG: MFS transporter [Candidatus Baldrarchaeota archaeon]